MEFLHLLVFVVLRSLEDRELIIILDLVCTHVGEHLKALILNIQDLIERSKDPGV